MADAQTAAAHTRGTAHLQEGLLQAPLRTETRASADGDESMSMDAPSLARVLSSDESYQGPPASGFENSRGESVVAFGQAVVVTADSSNGESIDGGACQNANLWAIWSNETSRTGERPKDFGFLCDSFGTPRGRSRTPSPDNIRSHRRSVSNKSEAASNGECSNSSRRRVRSPSPGASNDSTKARRMDDGSKDMYDTGRLERQISGSALTKVIEADSEPPPQPNKADKSMMCKFFLNGKCRRTNCNFAHSEAEQREACARIPCRFAALGTCHGGSNCLYRHDKAESIVLESSPVAPSESVSRPPLPEESRNQQDKTLLCKFFMKSRCSRKECNFAHSESEQKEACRKLPCRFDAAGTCRQGANCWYRHSEKESSVQKANSEVEDSESADMTMTKEIVSQDAALTKAKPSRVSQDQGDKTMMCKFWLKRRCQRNDCGFAHGEAEQRAACKKVRCRYEKRGGCTKGAECWYLHTTQSSEEAVVHSTPKKTPASPPTSITLTPSSPASSFTSVFRHRFESWADCSDSDDDFCPRSRVTSGTEGFPILVTA